MKKIKVFLVIVIVSCIFVSMKSTNKVLAQNKSVVLDTIVELLSKDEETLEFDLNSDNIFDILDVASYANTMGEIDLLYVYNTYSTIVKPKEKKDFEKLGVKIATDKAFVVDANGVNIYEYVNAASGLVIEHIEGDNAFAIEDNKLKLVGQAPAIAKIKLRNPYGVSDEFYVYGTTDKEMCSFLYDYLIYLSME